MTHESQQFGFFVEAVERHDGGRDVNVPATEWPWLAVPSVGKARLLVSESPPCLLTNASEQRGEPAVVVERIRHEHQPYLTMLIPGRLDLRTNGLPTAPVSILRIKDEVQVGTQWILHVSSYIKPDIGSADGAEAGGECPVCRTPIVADRTVYRCPHCGLLLHLDGEECDEGRRLECARAVSACPRCQLSLVTEEGFTYVPDN